MAKQPHLNAIQLVAYGFLSLPIALSSVIILTFVPTYYAIDLGLGLGWVGAIFVFGRLLDIVSDPLIGYFSDGTNSRFGPRIPWMIGGVFIFIPTLACILMPPVNVSFFYVIISATAFFLAYTVIDLPYSAVGLELSSYKNERTTLASVKAAFQVAGALLAAVLVAAFSGNMTQAFQVSATVVTVFSLIGVGLFMWVVPRYASPRREKKNIRKAISAAWSQGEYQTLMVAFFITQTGTALVGGLIALFVIHAVGDPRYTGLYIALLLISSALTLPVWNSLSKQIGKIRSWRAGLLSGAIIMCLVPLFDGGNVVLFSIYCVAIGSVLGADAILPTSVLADISSDDVHNNSNNAGLMLGYKNALSKVGFIAPMGLAFPLLGALGFDDGARIDDGRLWLLIGFFAFAPAALRITAFWIVGKIRHV